MKLALGGGDARPRSFWKELCRACLLQQQQHVAAIAEQSLESPLQLEKLALKVDQVKEKNPVSGLQQETHHVKLCGIKDQHIFELFTLAMKEITVYWRTFPILQHPYLLSSLAFKLPGLLRQGHPRKYTRWGDYALIAATTLVCLSTAMKTQGDFSRALILSSAMAIPFQPMLVTVLCTFLIEVCYPSF